MVPMSKKIFEAILCFTLETLKVKIQETTQFSVVANAVNASEREGDRSMLLQNAEGVPRVTLVP